MRILLAIVLCWSGFLAAQERPLNLKKSVRAVRTAMPPRIDGSPEDSVWAQAMPAGDFIMNSPDYGKPSVLRSEVRVLYDDDALYVCARLYDAPQNIRRQFTPRDGEQRQDVDYFTVFLDTYNDDQNAFQFTVTTRNVQSDARISSAVQRRFGSPGDYGWDAVWESKTRFTADGWVAELRIPYLSLRFSQADEQHWGVNFQRFSRRLNENSFWNPVNPNEAGFVNQFGDLEGFRDVRPPVRLSLLPYLSAGYRYEPFGPSGPATRDFLRSGGMDIKWGLSEGFTLDATLVPDFGQVISDNVVLNLSPFEVQFQENRPFFTEGTELFNKAGLFYSRRIGLTPAGYNEAQQRAADSNWRVLSNPGVTPLINATKFSGRTRGNLGIGVFNALSAPTFARFRNDSTGTEYSWQTAPLTNYNLLVLDKALKGRSSLTFTNSLVLRSGAARDAQVSALDISLFDRQNRYQWFATARYSSIKGPEDYDGYNARLSFRKVGGRIQFDVTQNVESERYDPNDLGLLFAPNEFTTTGQFSYNQLTPTKRFLSYRYSFNFTNTYLYKPFSWSEFRMGARAFYFFKNFWDVTFAYESQPVWKQDFFELRTPGRKIWTMPWHYFGIEGSTDSRKRWFLALNAGHGFSPAFPQADYFNTILSFRYRFSDRLSLEVTGESETDRGNVGYAFRREANGDPIAGWRNINQFTTLVSGICNFTSRMFLTLRVRHYWSRVRYERFFNIDADGYWIDRPFISGNDNNYNAYNLDMFFTWDFAYGSRFILGWKSWMPADQAIDGSRYKGYLSNLRQVFVTPQGREVTARVIFFLDYRKIRRALSPAKSPRR